MKPIVIEFEKDEDRVVNMYFVTHDKKHVYCVDVEVLAQNFGGCDEIHVCVGKPGRKLPGGFAYESPNTVLFNDECIARKSSEGSTNTGGGVWFEFHEVDGLPQVRDCHDIITNIKERDY